MNSELDHTALYTIRENGQEQYFFTDSAGGYSFPLLAYNGAVRMRRALNQIDSFGRVTLADMLQIARGNELFPRLTGRPYLFRLLNETEMITRMEDLSVAYMITLDFDAKEIRWEFNPNIAAGMEAVTMPVGTLNTSFNLRHSFMTEADRALSDIEFNELFVKRFIQKYTEKPQEKAPKPAPAKKHFCQKHKKAQRRRTERPSGSPNLAAVSD